MQYNYGMTQAIALSMHRTTFALDDAAVRRMKMLAEMTAGAAIVSNAEFAAATLDDFAAFEPFGLRLRR